MSLSDLASLGSFVSGAAVLASLVFLFFQMRQMTKQVRLTEQNQQALIRRGSRTRNIELLLTRTDPSVAEATAKGFVGDETISAVQYEQFIAYTLASFIHLEDLFFQHKSGLLTDSAFDASRSGHKPFFSVLGTRQFWENARISFAPEFAKFVDDLIADTPTRRSGELFDQWKAGLAAKKASLQR